MNSIFEKLEARRLFAGGDLDPTFGGDGIVTQPTPLNFFQSDTLAIGGKIVIAGGAQDSDEDQLDYFLRRFNADGTPDNAFGGGDSIATGTLGGAHVRIFRIEPASGGKIVAIADNTNGPFPIPAYVMRFNSDGSLDTTFSGDGFATFTLQNAQAMSLAVEPSGGVLVIHENQITRYTPSGDIDTNFGDNGTLDDPLDGRLFAAAGLADGKILLAGRVSDGTVGQWAIAKLNADGSFDTTFGDNGKSITRISPANVAAPFESITELGVLADGSILATGFSSGSLQTIARFSADGDLDTTFGDRGSRGLALTGTALRTFVDETGRIYTTAFNSSVARFTADGDLDPSFGAVFGAPDGYIGFPAGLVGGRFVFAGQPSGGADSILIGRLLEDDGNPSSITFANGTVTVNGTPNADDIFVQDVARFAAGNHGFGRLFDAADVDLVSVIGGDGNDTIFTARASTPAKISGGAGRDRLGGGDLNDTIEGNAQRDRIDGGGGDDLLVGNGGPDVIRGEDGNDSLGGGRHLDRLFGGNGNDHLEGGLDQDPDILHGDAGTDSAKEDEDDILTDIETEIP